LVSYLQFYREDTFSLRQARTGRLLCRRGCNKKKERPSEQRNQDCIKKEKENELSNPNNRKAIKSNIK
jgi:hypothetical protein